MIGMVLIAFTKWLFGASVSTLFGMCLSFQVAGLKSDRFHRVVAGERLMRPIQAFTRLGTGGVILLIACTSSALATTS